MCLLREEKSQKEGPVIMKKNKNATNQNPLDDIKYIKNSDELREIKGNYILQKGVYVIDSEIYVPKGRGLILEPGVEFHFTKDSGIICDGRFETKGTKGLEVLLTAKDKEKGWKNLSLLGNAEAILDYAEFSYGKGRVDKEGYISGGAILLEAENGLKPSLTINNSCFKNNSSDYGGAIFIYQSDVKVNKNNIFKNNYADCGGSISNYQGDIIIKDYNYFILNSAGYKGGAVYILQGNLSIGAYNLFEKNSAKYEGGAIRNYEGELNIDKSKNIFKNNTPDDISQE